MRASCCTLGSEAQNLEVPRPCLSHVDFWMICAAEVGSGVLPIQHQKPTIVESFLFCGGCAYQVTFSA